VGKQKTLNKGSETVILISRTICRNLVTIRILLSQLKCKTYTQLPLYKSIEMRLSRHQLWSGSSYDGAACRPRRYLVQVVPSDQSQLCGLVKLDPMAALSALPSCSTSPWRQTLERPRKNSHHARSTRTPTHSSPAGPLLVQFPVLKVLDFPKRSVLERSQDF